LLRPDHWKLYVRNTGRKEAIFRGIRLEGDRDFTITSVNPSHMLKAVFHGKR
jgi:hypothetical protein